MSRKRRRCRESANVLTLPDGAIRFVRAAIPTGFPANPKAVWAHLAKEFYVENVPGSHLEIMTTHYEKLASAISRYVNAAAPETVACR